MKSPCSTHYVVSVASAAVPSDTFVDGSKGTNLRSFSASLIGLPEHTHDRAVGAGKEQLLARRAMEGS